MTKLTKISHDNVLSTDISTLAQAESMLKQADTFEQASFWGRGKAFKFIKDSIDAKAEGFEEYGSFRDYFETADTDIKRSTALGYIAGYEIVERLKTKGVDTADLPHNERTTRILNQHTPAQQLKMVKKAATEMGPSITEQADVIKLKAKRKAEAEVVDVVLEPMTVADVTNDIGYLTEKLQELHSIVMDMPGDITPVVKALELHQAVLTQLHVGLNPDAVIA